MQVFNIKFFEHLFVDCFINILPDRGTSKLEIANPLLLISSLQNQNSVIVPDTELFSHWWHCYFNDGLQLSWYLTNCAPPYNVSGSKGIFLPFDSFVLVLNCTNCTHSSCHAAAEDIWDWSQIYWYIALVFCSHGQYGQENVCV